MDCKYTYCSQKVKANLPERPKISDSANWKVGCRTDPADPTDRTDPAKDRANVSKGVASGTPDSGEESVDPVEDGGDLEAGIVSWAGSLRMASAVVEPIPDFLEGVAQLFKRLDLAHAFDHGRGIQLVSRFGDFSGIEQPLWSSTGSWPR